MDIPDRCRTASYAEKRSIQYRKAAAAEKAAGNRKVCEQFADKACYWASVALRLRAKEGQGS